MIDTMTWKTFTPTGNITPRESHSAAYFNGKLYVYGGCAQSEATLSDFWALDIRKFRGKFNFTEKMHFSQLHWDFIAETRQGASYSLVGNKLFIFGGELDSV